MSQLYNTLVHVVEVEFCIASSTGTLTCNASRRNQYMDYENRLNEYTSEVTVIPHRRISHRKNGTINTQNKTTIQDSSASREEHVSFSAYTNKSQSGLNKRHIIKFEGTVLNLGHHYHPEDGIFIASVTGVYLFHWTINNYSDYTLTNILVGGKVISTTTTSVSSANNSGSAMVIVTVQKDEHVWIQTCCNTANEVDGNTLGLDNAFQSTFSETLLFSVV
ncbi:complement C1q tumor necrosis factor-related protein 2-like [Ostrea edulis]|uniref:complement C1q tumor necrosis factor-related protein 2-like n=1 Tax=Ostrea edulis TaxID=37623 RepID=UPI0024AF4375|nr:complement C1q tumor necrosis factor-related protein 2-like [Ostrea edulis]